MKGITIYPVFNIEDEVYVKTDEDQRIRIITGIEISVGNVLLYRLVYRNTSDLYYDFELSCDKNVKQM